ncbi:MAG TPA: hypothetical protein VG711_09870 [Phycisphaerales bacterium]|nr:hypothetical protein [Phycisphaerales bacterium]
MAFALLPFCIIWNGFLIFWYSIAFATNGPWIMILFPALHVAAGVYLTWYTAALFLNTSTICADFQSVQVSHSPLPWPGNARMASERIEQLFCESGKYYNNGMITYRVCARLVDGSKTKLITGLQEQGEALFIEQELERFLNIEDAAVPGELRHL